MQRATRITARGPLGRASHERQVARFTLPIAVVLLVLSGLGALYVAAAQGPSMVPWTPSGHGAPRAAAAAGTHWGHPGFAGLQVPAPSGNGTNGSNTTGPPYWNASFCDPLPVGPVIAELGLNFSFSTTPANGSGPAPMNFTWNLTVFGGGLPPYRAEIFVLSGYTSFLSTDFKGNVTLTAPVTYDVNVFVEDSTCSQVGSVVFPIFAWGSLGPHPVQVTEVTTTSTVPANVTYYANTSNLPTNWSIGWQTPRAFPGWTNVTVLYFLPGVYHATACFYNETGALYTCGDSPNVTVGGLPTLAGNWTATPGAGPVNLTFTAWITNTSILPANTSLYVYAWNGTVGSWAQTNNSSSLSLTEVVGCGYPWTPYVPTSGSCQWTAVASLVDPLLSVDSGFLGGITIVATIGANGTITDWYPSGGFSFGPVNGSAPINVSLNFSMTGGVAPYAYEWAAFGRSSAGLNGSFYAPLWGTAFGWNGSLTKVVINLNQSGVYWIELFLADSANNFLPYALPLVYVGNVSHYVPAPLVVRGSSGALAAQAGASVLFTATVQGGVAPYTVQWAFGDGTFGSSRLGESIGHIYSLAGTYEPVLTVTDARGTAITTRLAPVVVAPAPTPIAPGSGAGSNPWHWTAMDARALVVSVLAAVVFITAAVLLYRREIRRQGEELVAVGPGSSAAEPASESAVEP